MRRRVKFLGLGLWLAGGAVLLVTAPGEKAVGAVSTTAPVKIAVLARVAGHSVTDRQVLIDVLIEHPELYTPGKGKVPDAEFDQGLQRLLTQIMVTEENRIIGTETVNPRDIEAELTVLKKLMGGRYKTFLGEYELTDKEILERLGQKLTVQKALAERVRAATASATAPDPKAREEKARKAIEDWLNQLRSRYRVQLFRYQDKAS